MNDGPTMSKPGTNPGTTPNPEKTRSCIKEGFYFHESKKRTYCCTDLLERSKIRNGQNEKLEDFRFCSIRKTPLEGYSAF